MGKIRLNIKGLTYSDRQTGAYALLLQEEDGPRKIPIVIGGFEAQSIAMALDKVMQPPRPLTHDLFKNFAERFGATLEEVIIHQIKDGVFYSNMVWKMGDSEEIVDARPSDAISLAIRFGCPIYATDEVVEATGLVFEEGDEKSVQDTPVSETVEPTESTGGTEDLKKASNADLEKMMEQAVSQEDYELAARIRDELDKRSK
ncbi:hypothetical protein FLX56_28555 [Synechococcus moorigangaii CMS01]|nr:hypothetical protein [Synechococcus moorigangaii CMS01]